jgi:hypothetical protein
MNARLDGLLRSYLWVLLSGLLFQGAGSLVFRLVPGLPEAMPLLVRGAFGIDYWHAWIHIAWGLVGVAVLLASKGREPLVWLALVFGVFYTVLGVTGVHIHHPFGLELDLLENTFHLIAGPLSLLVGLVALLWPRWQAKRQPA